MKCSKCGHKNVRQAKYCFKCGNKFTKKEKEEAKDKGILIKILKIKDWYETLTLSKITGSIYWKIGSIALVLLIGIYSFLSNGYSFRIMESKNYTYQYNKKLDEYYVYIKSEETNLNLYLPHEVENLYLTSYSKKNKKINSYKYKNLKDMKLKINDSNEMYYKISYEKTENKRNTIKLYVIKKDGE